MNMADKKNTPGIYAKYKPSDWERAQRDMVYDRYLAMRQSPIRLKAEKVWEKGREQWEALRKDRGSEDWQSNHYVPTTAAVVETAISEIIDQSPKPMILPRGHEDVARAQVMEQMFSFSWEVSYSDLAEEDIVRDALTCGTGIGQEYYFKDVRKIKTKLKEGSKEYEEEEMVDYDNVLLEPVKLEDFYIDENARGFIGPYGARDCIRRFIMDMDSFKQFFKGPIWNPLDRAQYVEPGGDTNYYEKYAPPQGIDHGKQVEVLWYWSVKPADCLYIVANDVAVVLGPNPYKHKQLPFAKATDVRRTHQFYGKGEPELLESIQDETNVFRRMMIDRNHLDIDKMFYGSNRMNLSDEDTIARPHGFIGVPEGSEIKPVEYGDTPRSVELSLKHLEDDATIVTGINPRAQALPTAGTATEAAILKESTLKRIRLKVRRYEREFLQRVASLRVANILQYYTQPVMEKIVGEEGSLEFQNQMKELQERGLIVKSENGDMMRKRFRDIRLAGKEISMERGQPKVADSTSEFTFFELTPDSFLPQKGQYDIKIIAGSTLPISKPLLQSKTLEMYDRLIQLATANIGYDPIKLGDALLRVNDYNPSDFKKELPVKTDTEARLQIQVELANQENKLIMQGQQLPGTAYVGPIHTAIHVQFTSSPTFQNLEPNDPIVQTMTTHITEELAAQSEREGAGAFMGSPADMGGSSPAGGGGFGRPRAQATASGGANKQLTDMLSSKMQGGEQQKLMQPGI